MLGRDVANVRGESVVRVERVQTAHRAITDYLGDNRRGRDRGALLVSVYNRLVLWSVRAEPESIHQTRLSRRRQVLEYAPQAGQIAGVQSDPVDLDVGDDPDRDAFGAPENGAKKLFSLLGSELLGIVQEGERPYAVVSQLRVVEQDTRDNERARE